MPRKLQLLKRTAAWTTEQLKHAREMWEGTEAEPIGQSVDAIVRYLGITDTRRFYNLRRALGWRDRPQRGWAARNAIVFTYTDEEEAQAHEMWDAGVEGTKLAEVLHLENRFQVYKVARREGWIRRATGRPKLHATPPPPTPDNDPRPRHLMRACPECTYPVAPDTPESVWVADELFHARCAPRMRA